MDPAQIAVAITAGLVIGALLGLVGAGGSILAIPVLVYGLDLDVQSAVPASLVVVGSAALVAALPRLRHQIRWGPALVIGAVGIPAAWAGSTVARHTPDRLLLSIFIALMLAAALRMLVRDDERPGPCQLPSGGTDWAHCLPHSGLLGLAVGFLTGLVGVGGGFLIVPALALGVGIETAIGTSLVIITINSAAGLTSHLAQGTMPWDVVSAFAPATVLTSLVATRLRHHVPQTVVRKSLATIVLAVAAAMSFRLALA
ncbi:sulfite exporter TauE/SafE family protein [Solicola sp. PLA-1-18]|uniref:sulfite exporter TauE/SafE family protein n=1 Tax=Solicola sp. PLA-1-18 TaxID=3380532 RepID=UPI003B76055B